WGSHGKSRGGESAATSRAAAPGSARLPSEGVAPARSGFKAVDLAGQGVSDSSLGLETVAASRANQTTFLVSVAQIFLCPPVVFRTLARLEICSFSGYKIYPGHGKTFIRSDNRTFKFLNGKVESLFHQRKNPRKIHWTVVFRRMHKKGITEETVKKRSRKTVKHQRAVVGASWEAIRAKRAQKPEVRAAARDAAIRAAKETKKAAEEKKRVEKKVKLVVFFLSAAPAAPKVFPWHLNVLLACFSGPR
ncbi:MAG: ribosomal protein L24e-domain-containing protein, partial [Olpidium bornovanus]